MDQYSPHSCDEEALLLLKGQKRPGRKGRQCHDTRAEATSATFLAPPTLTKKTEPFQRLYFPYLDSGKADLDDVMTFIDFNLFWRLLCIYVIS